MHDVISATQLSTQRQKQRRRDRELQFRNGEDVERPCVEVHTIDYTRCRRDYVHFVSTSRETLRELLQLSFDAAAPRREPVGRDRNSQCRLVVTSYATARSKMRQRL